MSTPTDDISLFRVLSETRRILKANRKHFSILGFLFLLPFNILLIIYITTIFPIGSQSNSTFTIQILYTIVSWVFSISAIGTITYSAFNGYYNRPLELIPTLKSLSSSFLPLCSTVIVLSLIYYPIGFVTGILGVFVFSWLGSSAWAIIVIVLIFVVCITYLQVNWFICYVIVVVESKWGYEPLRRSAYLLKGMKMIALKMIILFGIPTCVFVYYYYISSKVNTDVVEWMFSMVVGSLGMTMLMLYSFSANVVLYVYCKKTHGELAMEIQPEEYVSLLVDDDGNKSFAAVVNA